MSELTPNKYVFPPNCYFIWSFLHKLYYFSKIVSTYVRHLCIRNSLIATEDKILHRASNWTPNHFTSKQDCYSVHSMIAQLFSEVCSTISNCQHFSFCTGWIIFLYGYLILKKLSNQKCNKILALVLRGITDYIQWDKTSAS